MSSCEISGGHIAKILTIKHLSATGFRPMLTLKPILSYPRRPAKISATPDTMKKSIPPLLAALALLSACAKVETAPSSPDGMAISFSPVLGSAKTKAGTDADGKSGAGIMTKADAATPGENFQFYSNAWYLPDGKTWDNDKADAEQYIVDETVSHYEGGKWKSPANTYYWPKGGSLTFLSYTCLSGTAFHPDAFKPQNGIETKTTVNKDGLKIENFYLSGADFDLLVADFAKDRRANLNGVPTLFRHKLARISFYVSQEEKTGSQTQDKYELTCLKLTNIYMQGDYSGGGYDNDIWSTRKEKNDYSIFSDGDGQQPIDVSTDFKPVGSYVMVIPQNLLATGQNETDAPRETPQIIISYTKNGEDQTDIERNLEILGTNYWDKGKEYKYYITFGSGDNPINFSGSIGVWEDGDNSGVDIGTK